MRTTTYHILKSFKELDASTPLFTGITLENNSNNVEYICEDLNEEDANEIFSSLQTQLWQQDDLVCVTEYSLESSRGKILETTVMPEK